MAMQTAVVVYGLGSGGRPGSDNQGRAMPVANIPSSGSGSRRHRRGPMRGACARTRVGALNPELASLPAADLMAYLHRHRSSKYAFAEVTLVLREHERRLAEAEDRIRATDQVVDGLRGEISTMRDVLSAAVAMVAEIRRAVDAEAQHRAEMEECRLRAIVAKARLQANSPAMGGMPGLGSEARDEDDPMATATKLQADTGARGRMASAQMEGIDGNVLPPCSLNMVASPPSPALDEDYPMDEETEVGLVDVADLSSNGEDALVEEGHREGASEVISCKRKESPEDKDAQGNDDALVNVHALAVIPREQVMPETPQEARADGTRRINQRPVWKLQKTGTFYKMDSKALKEKEMEKAFPPNYRCWLNAPRSSRSVNMENPDPEEPQK